MKNYRTGELTKPQTSDNSSKYFQIERKTFSPQSNQSSNRALQYDSLAKKAK